MIEDAEGFAARVNALLGGQEMTLDEMARSLERRLLPDWLEWPPLDGDGEPLEIGQYATFILDLIDPETLGVVPGGRECRGEICAFRCQGHGGWVVIGENKDAVFEVWASDVFGCPDQIGADGKRVFLGDAVRRSDYPESADTYTVRKFGQNAEGEWLVFFDEMGSGLPARVLKHSTWEERMEGWK